MKVLFLISVLFLASCATNIDRTQKLNQGQTQEEVVSILGKPDSVQMKQGFKIYKYSLLKPFTGGIPHYLFFDQNGKLVEWSEDMNEFRQNQADLDKFNDDLYRYNSHRDNMALEEKKIEAYKNKRDQPTRCVSSRAFNGDVITNCN